MTALRFVTATFLLVLAVNAQEADKAPIQTRAIDAADAAANSGDKFKVYVGTIDGVRRELFNEVPAAEEFIPSGDGNIVDPFGAYDDNLIISTENEKNLFVPKPYRPNGQKKEPTTTTQRPTLAPTTIRTIPPVIQTLPPVRAPVPTAAPFRPVQPLQTIPTTTTSAPVTQFRPAPFQPQRPQPRPFQPEPLPTIVTPNRQPPPPPPAPFRPQPRPQQPQQPQPQPSFTRAPFRQPAPTTAAPRLPFAGLQNLRTGVCPASIFYISTPITGPSRLTFTHFAVAVTVDQCARTCHEFNCAIAHYNPSNGHCEFNPSTSFAIRNGQCPAWPSLHYRNNVVASESVRIFCVQCQRPRRRPTAASTSRVRTGFTGRTFDPQQQRQRTIGLFRPTSSRHHVIHGVLVKQPQAIALGTTQQQFIGAIGANSGEEGVELKARGALNYVPQEARDAEQLSLVSELEKLQN